MGERRHTEALRFSPLGEGPRRATSGDGLALSIDSETGVLTDVLLCRPDHYRWIETNAIAVQTLGSGRRIDAQRLQGEFRQLEDALDQAGARRHYIEPEPHLPYQVYTRDSSQTTPWGPALTQLALPPRRGEIASILRFHGVHNGFWRYCSHGAIEGGDIHIIRPGLLLVGWSGIRTTREGAAQFARWFADEGWETKLHSFPNISFTSTFSSVWLRLSLRWPASRSWATISPTG